MMRPFPAILSLLLIVCAAAAQDSSGYDIRIRLKPYQDQWVYLGHYYGKGRALADSALLDGNSEGRFRGDKPLEGGIYFVVSPSKQILFELLIDGDRQFSISADSAGLPGSLQVEGSPANTLFLEYSRFAHQAGQAIHQLREKLAAAQNASDSANLMGRIRVASAAMNAYRDSLADTHPESFLAALFRAMEEPVIPPATEHPGGRYDSNFVYEYYKEHYWDGVSFSDARLVRTPFFEERLDKYFRDLVPPHPDSLIREIDHILLYARSSPEMFRYLFVYFVQQYIQPKYMGHDAVFVHLFEKYINTGQTPFLTPAYTEFATRRAYSLMANLIGKQAPPLDLLDTLDRPLPLYSLQAPFTVVCFWDPGCSHCKDVVPRLDSIYEASWKAQGVRIYAVKTDGSRAEWVDFIRRHGLDGWAHVYQPDSARDQEIREQRPGYRQLYDVYQTPLLYLLDEKKRIVAKKLSYLQMDEVIRARISANKAP